MIVIIILPKENNQGTRIKEKADKLNHLQNIHIISIKFLPVTFISYKRPISVILKLRIQETENPFV